MPNKVLFGPEKLATISTPGLLKASGSGSGLQLDSSGYLKLSYPGANTIKAGSNLYAPVVVGIQHESVFYGLAKAAGDSTQAASSNAVGTYTDNAKTAIQNMLSVPSSNNPIFTGSFSLGRKENTTVGANSFAFGYAVEASGNGSHAEGSDTTASGIASHAEGALTTASNVMSHAEGAMTVASGTYAHAEGNSTIASHVTSHAEGNQTTASGAASHAEGYLCTATNEGAHAEGIGSTAAGRDSHAEGLITIASGQATHAAGKWNIDLNEGTAANNFGTYAEIIGNGTSDNTKSNARALDWTGNEYLNGYLYVGCNADSSGGTRVPHDIQINGSSIVNNGVATIPAATTSSYGVVKVGNGLEFNNNTGAICTDNAADATVKAGVSTSSVLNPARQHIAVFYGLAKAAGDTYQASSNNTIGNYTLPAKSKIYEMLSSPVIISGVTTTTIDAYPGITYVCGEMTSISISVPPSGCIDVLFKSGSTPTTLTITPTKTGVTAINWANGFDPATIEANATYEINILDGEYGVACKWT